MIRLCGKILVKNQELMEQPLVQISLILEQLQPHNSQDLKQSLLRHHMTLPLQHKLNQVILKFYILNLLLLKLKNYIQNLLSVKKLFHNLLLLKRLYNNLLSNKELYKLLLLEKLLFLDLFILNKNNCHLLQIHKLLPEVYQLTYLVKQPSEKNIINQLY